jgi:hypothetical protein
MGACQLVESPPAEGEARPIDPSSPAADPVMAQCLAAPQGYWMVGPYGGVMRFDGAMVAMEPFQ